MWNKLSDLHKIALFVIFVISSTVGATTYFAKASDIEKINSYVAMVDNRLELKIINDDISYLTHRLWELQDRYKKSGDTELLKTIREIELKIKQLEEEKKMLTK